MFGRRVSIDEGRHCPDSRRDRVDCCHCRNFLFRFGVATLFASFVDVCPMRSAPPAVWWGVFDMLGRLDDGVIVRDIVGGGWFTLWAIAIGVGVIIWARSDR